MTGFKAVTLVCTLVACLTLFGAHIVMARFWLAKRPLVSPQKATALLSVYLNIPLLLALVGKGLWSHVPVEDIFASALYTLLVFNSVAYSYFLLFSLSETGRRIRILLQLLEGDSINTNEHATNYSSEAMVRQRLLRLGQMGQISETSGRYRVNNRFLLRVAKLIRFIGILSTGRMPAP